MAVKTVTAEPESLKNFFHHNLLLPESLLMLELGLS